MKVGRGNLLNKDLPINKQVDLLNRDVQKMVTVIDGRIRFGGGSDGEQGENVHGEFQVVADTGSANTEFSVTHLLGAVPIGYLVTKISNAGVIYDSGTPWTDTTIYLKSSAANSAVTLFLLK